MEVEAGTSKANSMNASVQAPPIIMIVSTLPQVGLPSANVAVPKRRAILHTNKTITIGLEPSSVVSQDGPRLQSIRSVITPEGCLLVWPDLQHQVQPFRPVDPENQVIERY